MASLSVDALETPGLPAHFDRWTGFWVGAAIGAPIGAATLAGVNYALNGDWSYSVLAAIWGVPLGALAGGIVGALTSGGS